MRSQARSGAGRCVLGVLAGVLLVTCGEARAQFQPGVPARRLGQSPTHLTVGTSTRPVLDSRVQKHALDLAPTSLGVVELAVTPAAGSKTAPGSTHCRATLSAPDLSEREVATFEKLEAGEWTIVYGSLPSLGGGGVLTLGCDEGASVVWARPVLLPAAPGRAEPLVVLLSLDTLRADYVAGFGAAREQTPALGGLGREGLVFTAAVSPYTWTLPAHFSLFYSRLYGFPPGAGPIGGLAGTLSDAGFATAGFAGGGFVGASFQFHLGFDRFSEYGEARYGSEMLALTPLLSDAQKWIDEHASVASFVFLHSYAVHQKPSRERTRSFDGFLKLEITPELVSTARRVYGELVEELDEALAPFFAELRRIAAKRPTLLVVVSDHGEAFGEHGNFRHGIAGKDITLHDELIRIPMIFWAPGIVAPGGVASHPFSLVDVAPTLLASAGIARPKSMAGRDFWPLVGNQPDRFLARYQSSWETPVVSYKNFTGDSSAAWSTRTASLKRIVQQPAGTVPGKVEVYDLQKDPGETKNLAGPSDDTANGTALDAAVAELNRVLADLGVGDPGRRDVLPICPSCDWQDTTRIWSSGLPSPASASPAQEPEPFDDESRDRLIGLGYLD